MRFRVWGFASSESADLGGRVGWLPKAERVNLLPFSLTAPKRRGWGGGGG